MSKQFNIFIGIDIGVSGGIAIIDNNKSPVVYKMPTEQIIVNKKKKKVYNIIEIVKILKPYKNKKTILVQEKVSAFSGQGVTSSFNFGKSTGITLGIGMALGFKMCEISPQKWKKHFPELNTEGIQKLRDETKRNRLILKGLREHNKILKDKTLKKVNNKAIKDCGKLLDRLNRQIKSISKDEARFVVSNLYPELNGVFKNKNSDGLAESLLLALFGRDKSNELV